MKTIMERLSIDMLVQRCQSETDNFFQDRPVDDRYCFELFRRALTQGDEAAWQALIVIYRCLVRGWLQSTDGVDRLDLPVEELEWLSFEKFWQSFAVPTRRCIKDFNTLGELLKYLKMCCRSVVIDAVRRQQRRARVTHRATHRPLISTHDVEREILDRRYRAAFWQQINDNLQNELERLVIHCSYLDDMPPRAILARYPEHFKEVTEVYKIKRNALRRLRRDESLPLDLLFGMTR